jgi:hypothetical protein
LKRLVFLISFMLMIPAATQAQKYSTTQLCEILQPCEAPARYASGPYLAKPAIRHVSLKQIQGICGSAYSRFLGPRTGHETVQAAVSANAGFGTLGCAQLTASACIVHVPSDLRAVLPDLYRLVLAHELAHCRGWVH